MISINEFSVKREEHTHDREQGILPITKEFATTLIGVPLDHRDVRVAASLLLLSRHSIRAITRFIKRRALSQRRAPCATKDPPSASRDCVLICPISQQAVQRSGRSWGLPFMTSAPKGGEGWPKHDVGADRLRKWHSERGSKVAKFLKTS